MLSGMLTETFVVNELITLASWSRDGIRVHHYRTVGGAEIDALLERSDGTLFAIEVKAGVTVGGSAFSAIRGLAAACPGKFIGGVVLYAGAETITFAKNLFAVPISALWRA